MRALVPLRSAQAGSQRASRAQGESSCERQPTSRRRPAAAVETRAAALSVAEAGQKDAGVTQERPLFSFGVAADAQYADIPDGRSFHGVPRYYRGALPALRRAVSAWKDEDVAFGMHLGDILDGFQPKDSSEEALTAVLSELQALGRPTYHMLGNHCLYNLPRARLNERLGIHEAPGGASYYSFSHCGYRFIVLDSYDVSMLGWPEEHPLHQQARRWLLQNNPNQELNSPEGLVGLKRRFVKFGGGVSDAQLAWLAAELQAPQAAKEAKERVLVFGHLPLCPETCPPVCLLWNYDAVLKLLQRSGVVAATFAGHTHQNGYVLDRHGIHHIVLPGIVETPADRDAYGVVDVYLDRLCMRGTDTMLCVDAPLGPCHENAAPS